MVLAAIDKFNTFSEMSFETLLGVTDGVTKAMQSVGVGLASIFIMFVIFSCVHSILDGSQFQTKMLFPVVIYLIVTSFGIVTSTTKTVVKTIHTKANEACLSVRKECLRENTTLLQYYMNCASTKTDFSEAFKEKINKSADELAEYGGFIDPDNDKSSGTVKEDIASPFGGQAGKENDVNEVENEKAKRKGIAALIVGLWESIKREFVESLLLWTDTTKGKTLGTVMAGGFSWIVALICQWVCSILSFVMSNWGAINISILIAFGPITWAFAVFPNNLRTVGSWFIRLVQFALYSPIVNLIAAACFKILSAFASSATTGVGSALAILSILVLNIFAMVNVPTIATMIIEGAQGSLSLVSSASQIAQATEPFRDMRMGAALRR